VTFGQAPRGRTVSLPDPPSPDLSMDEDFASNSSNCELEGDSSIKQFLAMVDQIMGVRAQGHTAESNLQRECPIQWEVWQR
jgi:hypothetical protein